VPTTIALIEWRSATVPSRVYEVSQDEDGLVVSSPDDGVFVGRWQTLDEVRAFIAGWMAGEIIHEEPLLTD
jgi:hypothetical protein